MLANESQNAWDRGHEGMGQVDVACVSHCNKQGNSVFHDRSELVGAVADVAVVGDGDPFALTDLAQPIRVRAVLRKMICVPFDVQTGVTKNGWKLLAQIAVGEKDRRHALGSGCALVEHSILNFFRAEVVVLGNLGDRLAHVQPLGNR